MKAISVRQPWATLIVRGIKDIENRSWPTTHRGRLLIHASKTPDSEAIQVVIEELAAEGIAVTMDDFPLGGIVGEVEVLDCVRAHPSHWFSGPWGWVLAGTKQTAFAPLRGRLGLFDVVPPSA